MKTILVPTDFSECAKHALDYAHTIAKKTKAKIILLHIVQSPNHSSSLSEVPYMMGFLNKTKKKMKSLISSLKASEIEITDVVETGDVSKTINLASKKHKADLIVMGTHGAKGMNEVFIGSNASHVVRDAEIPVLTVNDGKQNTEINNIVFATDFTEETNLVFPFIKYFAGIFGAKIHLLKIVTDSDLTELLEAKKESKKFKDENNFDEYPVQIIHHLTSKDKGIRRFAELIHADMIALGTHGRHGLSRFFKGSVAENMVNHAVLPVLTVNFHKKILTKARGENIFDKKVKQYESDLLYQIPII